MPTAEIVQPEETITGESMDRIRARCKESLFFFSRAILGFHDFDKMIHKPICDILQDEGRNRQIIVMPRTWFKSTMGSVAYPIWRSLNDPNVRILICQNSFTNAVKKLNSIKQIFENNQLFRSLFPELLPGPRSKWSNDVLTVNRSASHPEGTFEAAGTGSATTSRHYDLIIEDDTVSPEKDSMEIEMQQPTGLEIQKAIGWHKLATPLLIHPLKSKIVIIGTRWCEEDLIGYVMENQKNYDVLTRAVTEKDGKPASKEEGGTPAWPGRFNDEVLDEVAAALGPYMYATLMLNKPTSAVNRTFRREWVHYYDSIDPAKCITCTTVDPAASDKEATGDPDYNVVMTTGVHLELGLIYVLNYVRERMNPGRLIDNIFIHQNLYSPVDVKVEAVAYQRTLKYWIEQRQKKLQRYFGITALANARVSKADRIRAMEPFFANNLIHIRPEMDQLERELFNFPAARGHDDVIDALSMHVSFWNDYLSQQRRAAKQSLISNPFSGQSILDSLEHRNARISQFPYDIGLMRDRLAGAPRRQII